MANYSTLANGKDSRLFGPNAYAAASAPSWAVIEGIFDASQRTLAFGSSDTLEIADIPKGFLLKGLMVEVLTPETGAPTAQITVQDSAATALRAAAAYTGAAGTLANTDLGASPVFYSAASKLRVLASVATALNMKLLVRAYGVYLGG